MKKKYKKIMLFLSLCLSLIIGLTVSSHAYYYDSDTGNLESSNLFSIDTSFSVGGGDGSFTRDNNSFTFNVISASDFYIVTPNGQSFTSGTYTFSLSSYEHIQLFVIQENNNWRTSSAENHTLVFDNDFNLKIRIDVDESFTGSFSFNLMVNSGSSALSYEPFGVTFYSQINYNEYGDNRYSVGFSDAIQYDSVSPVSMENLSECTYYVNGSSGSSSGWFVRTFILNGSLVDSSGASEDDGFNTSYGLFSGSQDFVDFVLDDYGIHLTSETPSELGQESYIEFVLSRAYSSDNFSCTLGLAFTHLDCFNSSGALVYSFANDNSSIVNRNYVLSNVPLSNISVFKLYFNQDTVLDESPVFLNISPLESAFNSGYLKGISDNSVNYDYGRQKFNEGYQLGLSDGQNSSLVSGSNFQKLIWTIGATPFESFKTIWDVDVMGLNISGIILGSLMALLVLYLIKKIWK